MKIISKTKKTKNNIIDRLKDKKEQRDKINNSSHLVSTLLGQFPSVASHFILITDFLNTAITKGMSKCPSEDTALKIHGFPRLKRERTRGSPAMHIHSWIRVDTVFGIIQTTHFNYIINQFFGSIPVSGHPFHSDDGFYKYLHQ